MLITQDKTNWKYILLGILVILLFIGLTAPSFSSRVSIGVRDALIKSSIYQTQILAELIYDDEGSYENVNCDYENTYKDIKILCDDIKDKSGIEPTIHTNKEEYCAYVKLTAKEISYYCIDSSGETIETYTDPSGTNYCDGKTFLCPKEKGILPLKQKISTDILIQIVSIVGGIIIFGIIIFSWIQVFKRRKEELGKKEDRNQIKEKIKSKKWFYILIVVILVAVVDGGISNYQYYLSSKKEIKLPKEIIVDEQELAKSMIVEFMNVRMNRDIDKAKSYLTDNGKQAYSQIQSIDFALVGISNPHFAKFEILETEKINNNKFRSKVRIHEKYTEQEEIGYFDETITIIKIEKKYFIDFVEREEYQELQHQTEKIKDKILQLQKEFASLLEERIRITKSLQFSQVIQNILRSNAVGIWRFEENGNGTCLGGDDICDTSGGENHGYNNETIWTIEGDTPNNDGYALNFDGIDNYVNNGPANDILPNGSSFTIALWVKPDSQIDFKPTLIGTSTSGRGYALYFYNGKFWFYLGVSGNAGPLYNDRIIIPDTDVPIGKWTFITATWNQLNGKMRLYINGTETGEPFHDGIFKDWWYQTYENYYSYADPVALWIGGDDGGSDSGGWGTPQANSNYKGVIDEVMIFSQVLTTAEIEKYYTERLKEHKLVEK